MQIIEMRAAHSQVTLSSTRNPCGGDHFDHQKGQRRGLAVVLWGRCGNADGFSRAA